MNRLGNHEGKRANIQGKTPSIAIVGGGISGLAVAYELARRGAGFVLFEASGRLGGIVETVRTKGFVIECGPDSWVTEKPWARELAVELGLEDQIVGSNDRGSNDRGSNGQHRRTYIVKEGQGSPRLVPMPNGMRMMVPAGGANALARALKSPLFSPQARLAYLREPERADEFQAAAANGQDESVADFVRRHFGDEATRTIAGPLLAGIFGGDIETLSVRAVMPAFAAMEAEYGSLITALRKPQQGARPVPSSIFSTLNTGLETLIDRIVAQLPAQSLHLHQPVDAISFDGNLWRAETPGGAHFFHSIVLATPPHVTRGLLAPLGGSGPRMAGLLPQHATSAIVVALAFDAAQTARLRIPRGFGFLVPPPVGGQDLAGMAERHSLLACTFVDQKFARRAPSGAVLLRAFFGGHSAQALLGESDEALGLLARQELARILNAKLGEAVETVVRRWPLSMPQYTVGHIERIAELESLARAWRGLFLAGNAYHGVGLPDLIREGRATAAAILAAEGCGSAS